MSNPFLELLPVYPLIAQQILDDYQITRGKCLDIGTGYGYLGIELAKITELDMYFVDLNPEALARAKENAAELKNATHFVGADVCALPFEDNFAELIISRGSLWFWQDQVKGLQEIYRVLKVGGITYVGGGLGRYTPPTMRKRLKGKRRKGAQEKQGSKFLNQGEIQDLLNKAGINNYHIVHDTEGEDDESGIWIEMRK